MSSIDNGGIVGGARKAVVFTFGEYLKQLREEHNLTQKQVAKLMGLTSAQKVCDIECGRRYHKRVSLEMIQNVAKAFNVPIAEVFTKVNSTLSITETTEEIVNELVPLALMTEHLALELNEIAGTYSQEVEHLSNKIHLNIKKVVLLSKLILKRTVRKSENTEG